MKLMHSWDTVIKLRAIYKLEAYINFYKSINFIIMEVING